MCPNCTFCTEWISTASTGSSLPRERIQGAAHRPGKQLPAHALNDLDRHKPDDERLAEWCSTGEDHLFLAETRGLTPRMGTICSSSGEGGPAVRLVKIAGQPVRYPPSGRALCPPAAVRTPKLGERNSEPTRGIRLSHQSGAALPAPGAIGTWFLSLEQKKEGEGVCH